MRCKELGKSTKQPESTLDGVSGNMTAPGSDEMRYLRLVGNSTGTARFKI